MAPNKKSVEIVVEETGEVFELHTGSLIANVRDALLNRRRQDIAATTWKALKEKEQRREIETYNSFAEQLVQGIVDVVASGGVEVIHAMIDDFKVKNGVVTIKSSGTADDGALLQLNHAGKKPVKIVVMDPHQFDQSRPPVETMPDQPDMLDEDKPADDDQEPFNDDADPIEGEDEGDGEGENLADAMGDAIRNDPDATDEERGLLEDVSEAYKGGYSSREGGYDRADNPFEKNSDKWTDWDAGWVDADDAENEAWPDKDPDEGEEAQEEVEPEAADEEEERPLNDAAEDGIPPMQLGREANRAGKGLKTNPFEDGTDEFAEWQDGWETSAIELNKHYEDGYAARQDGKAPGRNPFKEDCAEKRTWAAGYAQAKSEETD